MQVDALKIPEVLLIVPRAFGDNRGRFSETYKKSAYVEAGVAVDFVQDNRSLSLGVGTIRGLHFQTPPFAQSKLVSVQAGRVYDVAVDLRRGSATFGQYVSAELSAEKGEQLFIPIGFAHGFCTLEPNTVVTYKVDQYYAPANEAGFHWLTQELAIDWPCRPEDGVLSAKDAILPDRIDPAVCFP
jgi:dTDP-4-dehydrorhamnose 3,5-epimerase